MDLSRRKFLALGGSAAASTVLNPFKTVEAALGALGGNDTRLAVAYLLAKRQKLLMGGFGDDPEIQPASLDEITSSYRDAFEATEQKYLGPVGWDPSLLTPAEARQFEDDIYAVRKAYASTAAPLKAELKNIDAGLLEHSSEVKGVLKESETYYGLQRKLGDKTLSASTRSQIQAQLDTMQEPIFDPITVEDAGIVADGGTPTSLKQIQDSAGELDSSVSDVVREVRDAIRGKKPDDWKEKRKEAQLEYISETLQELASEAEVRIESTLTKRYGNDDWVITTRMHPDEIGEEKDNYLHSQFEDIVRKILEIYPERARDAKSFISHVRPDPKKHGFGEHDCERLIITNPDFALRESLRKAETANLRMHNEKNNTPTLAR